MWKALLDDKTRGDTPEYLVAAKTVLDGKASAEARNELLQEATVMAQVEPHATKRAGIIFGWVFVLISSGSAQVRCTPWGSRAERQTKSY